MEPLLQLSPFFTALLFQQRSPWFPLEGMGILKFAQGLVVALNVGTVKKKKLATVKDF